VKILSLDDVAALLEWADPKVLLKPRVHPNGFIQLDLPDRHRLHVWPKQPIRAQKTRHTIHDHAFDMTSRVLRGSLVNLVYREMLGDSFTVYKASHGMGEETTLVTSGRKCGLWPEMSKSVAVGTSEEYSMEREVLHDSLPVGLTVTIMKKTMDYPRLTPRIMVPKGVEPDNEFQRERYLQADLWAIIDEALA
jgi:hypothetical protein